MIFCTRGFVLAATLASVALATPNPSEGCGKHIESSLTPGGPSRIFSFDSNAGDGTLMKRRVRIHLPESYESSTPAPLILAFHGKLRESDIFERVTDLSNPKFNKNAIVLYPEGIDLLWTGDPYAPMLHKNNDIKFTGELLDHIESSFCVDKSRIYATGFSNGGGLTHLLACDPVLSSRIAAFAIASGAFFTEQAMKLKEPMQPDLFNPSNCKPSRSPIPIIEFHGAADDLYAYDGSSTFDGPTYPITQWLRGWAERNNCEYDSRRTTPLMHGRVDRYDWDCGVESQKPVLQHYYLHATGHTWPSVSMLEGEEDFFDPLLFDGTPIITEFFAAHELPDKPIAETAADETEKGSPAEASTAEVSPSEASPAGTEEEVVKIGFKDEL